MDGCWKILRVYQYCTRKKGSTSAWCILTKHKLGECPLENCIHPCSRYCNFLKLPQTRDKPFHACFLWVIWGWNGRFLSSDTLFERFCTPRSLSLFKGKTYYKSARSYSCLWSRVEKSVSFNLLWLGFEIMNESGREFAVILIFWIGTWSVVNI